MSAPPEVANVMSHLRDLRQQRGMSLLDVSRQVDAWPRTISGWERGHVTPSLAHTLQYLRVLGLRLSCIEEARHGNG